MKATFDLSRVAVVLVRPSHPGNIGSAARAMKTMGLADLVLVGPRHFPHAEADALAAGARDVLDAARVHDDLAAALADRVLAVGFSARRRDLSHPVREWRELAPEVLATPGPVALVFGNETSGLSNDELLRCQRFATFASNPAYGSLNLAAAVQVAAYEIALAARAFEPGAARPRSPATGADLEGLHARLNAALVGCGFLDPAKPGRLDERMRRLASRLDLEREEVDLLRGMLDALSGRDGGRKPPQ
jgi:tRNA/rRNA methyltransferase